MKIKEVLRVVCVVLVTMLLILFFASVLTPTWLDWNNDNTVKGFYREPKNRLQAVFAGTSQSLNGIAPTELYHSYGICAYNLSSEQQPLLASYYWIKEAERLHGDTLRAVVLDLSFVFQSEDQRGRLSMNEKALAHMRFSRVKLEAYRALAEQYDINAAEYINPLTRYHSRWSSVTKDDFLGLTTLKNYFYTRGQNLQFDISHDIKKPADWLVPQYELTEQIDQMQWEIDDTLVSQNMEYLRQIVDFCRERDLALVFIKIAKPSTDVQHDALQYLADSYDVPLIDFNLVSVQEAAGLDFPFDYWDEKHANVAGAQKMTNYIGAFLKDRCDLNDVRKNADYDYLKRQDDEYQAVRDGIALMKCENLPEYLRQLKNDRFTVFVSAKGDPGSGMTDEARAAFGELGLNGLKTVASEEPYVGVISGGSVLLDEKGDPWERLYADGTFTEDGDCTVRNLYRVETNYDGEPKTALPKLLSKENTFSLESAGFQSGNLCTVKFNGGNRADSRRGVNFIVYDRFLKRIVDRSSFDTCTPEMRRSDHQLEYEYLVRLDVSHMSAAPSIVDYLAVSGKSDSCTTILCCTYTEDTDLLSEQDRGVLAQCGVENASLLEKQPCIAVIRGGQLLAWITGDPSETIHEEIPDLLNFSVQKKPGGDLTVKIANESFPVMENSVYVIAYNGKLNRVINNRYLRMP